jgi:hypothetical protein
MKNARLSPVILCCASLLFLCGCSSSATLETDPALAKLAEVKLETEREIILLVIEPKSALPRERYITYDCFKGTQKHANGMALIGGLVDSPKKDGRIVLDTLCKPSEVSNIKVGLSG